MTNETRTGAANAPTITFGNRGDQAAAVAGSELSRGLTVMLGREVAAVPISAVSPLEMRIAFGDTSATASSDALDGDSFTVSRDGGAIVIRAGTSRGLIHAVGAILEKLGARFAPGAPPVFPKIELQGLRELEPFQVRPPFRRRAFISDIMTWNYSFPDRFELHLRHDREFIPWMAIRGINAFEFIRHAHDTRLKIDEIAPLWRERGIGVEYGGHVLQTLLPRDRFEKNPEFFPAGGDGKRAPRGNLCVSNSGALALVREGALAYVHEHPENELLHIWGADVWSGAWCRCGSCRELPPHLQYMEVVNAIAAELAGDTKAPPVAYLAYHDTIEPHPGLKPLANVCVEWAPRERCYVHAIDDADCAVNPRLLDSLRRYMEIFEGRCHVFEYYADTILFGGLGFATPSVIARDLRAYHAIGVRSMSCLTFGAYSTMAYPVNLEAFVRGTRSLDFDPVATIADTAAGRHPACADEMAAAYRAIERASDLVLDYGDVMRPIMVGERAVRKSAELREAVRSFDEALVAANTIKHSVASALSAGERELWRYSGDVLAALADYIAARAESYTERRTKGEAAIKKVAGAIERIRAIDPEVKGTWGAYDLEWIRELWLHTLRAGLEHNEERQPEGFG
ncbi:MAG TPA: DUF4838 domain-containing protein [Candidatus Binataceae bacterium]|nr:DUF4838 domain-containing protein [Candidatus Binataceae bacterium]